MKRVLFFITLIIVAILFFKTNNSYYNPEKNYLYDFNSTDAKILHLRLENQTIKFNKNYAIQYDTAFLKVNIASTFWGNFLKPSIEILNGNKILKTYFAPKSNGIRYINISSLLKGKAIYLNLNRVKIKKSIDLILFKKHKLQNKTILFIAPHPDDAEIAGFGFYSKYYKNSYIVTITAGDAGPNNYKDINFPEKKFAYFEKAKMRIINSFSTPLIGGINYKHSINLGYFDATLKDMYENRDKIVSSQFTHFSTTTIYRKYNISPLSNILQTKNANWYSLIKDLSDLIRKIKPDIIATPYPAIDAHPDHQYTSIALFEALKKLRKTNIKLYLYTNHFIFDEQYPYGEKFATMDLPPIIKKPLYFQNIFSYNLSNLQQREKILALDSMNDLRTNIEYLNFTSEVKLFIKDILKRLHLKKDESYFRRAIRSEELFYVINSNILFNKKIYQRVITPLPR